MTARPLIATALIALSLVLPLGLAGTVDAAPERPAAAQAGPSRDGQNRRIRIHNQTGSVLQGLRAADVRTEVYGGELLGGSPVASGSSVQVLIDDGSGACLYDIRAELAGGQALVRENINVCRIADFYLTK